MSERPLTGPFTLFGLVVGVGAAAHFVKPELESVLGSLMLVAMFTATLAVLGRWLTHAIGAWQGKTILVFVLAGALYIGVGGTIAELASEHHTGQPVATFFVLLLVGAFFGLLVAVPSLVPLAVLMRGARRLGRARPGSVIDGSDRRLLWLAWAGALLVWNAVSYDLGIGDEVWEQWSSPLAAQGEELHRLVRGDRELAQHALREARCLAYTGLVLSLACGVAHLTQVVYRTG